MPTTKSTPVSKPFMTVQALHQLALRMGQGRRKGRGNGPFGKGRANRSGLRP